MSSKEFCGPFYTVEYVIEDDELFRKTSTQYTDNARACKYEPIIDKETFLTLIKEWVLKDEDGAGKFYEALYRK